MGRDGTTEDCEWKTPIRSSNVIVRKKQAHHLFIRARLLFGRHLVNPLILTGWPIDRHMESHTLPFFFFRRSSCVRKISRPQINPIIQSNCRNSVISSGCQLIHANFGFTLFLPKFHPRRSKEVLHTVTATPEAITESARIWTNWNVVEWKARLVLTHRTTNLQWAISHQSLKASASGERAEIRTKLTRYIDEWLTDQDW